MAHSKLHPWEKEDIKKSHTEKSQVSRVKNVHKICTQKCTSKISQNTGILYFIQILTKPKLNEFQHIHLIS